MNKINVFARKTGVLLLLTMILLASVVLGGCNAPDKNSTETNHKSNNASSAQLVKEFETLVQETGKLPQAFQFIDEHIHELSGEDASHVLITLEDVQIKEFASIVDRYYEGNNQEQLTSIYGMGDSLNDLIDKASDESLKSLLTETRDSGYLLSAAEGMFSPDIDYSKVSPYLEKTTNETKAYFELRETESKMPSLRDAALVISWGELLDRELAAEQFATKYPNAVRIKEVISLRDNYKATIFYGANNTPLFSYDTNTMDSEARKAYESALNSNTENESPLMKDLEQFMTAAAKDNYKLTKAVKKLQSKFAPLVESPSE